MDRVPSLNNYLVVGETINDDCVTVAVHDNPKRRSSRIQHSTLSTEKRSIRDKETDSNLLPEHSGNPATSHSEKPQSGVESGSTSKQDDRKNLETTLATTNNTLEAMKDEYTELKEDMVGLIETLNDMRTNFNTLQQQLTKILETSAQYQKEMNDIVSSGLDRRIQTISQDLDPAIL